MDPQGLREQAQAANERAKGHIIDKATPTTTDPFIPAMRVDFGPLLELRAAVMDLVEEYVRTSF